MKKIIVVISAIMLGIVLVSCSGNTKGNKGYDASSNENFIFETNGIEIKLHEEAEDIISNLEEYKEYFEAESCAFEGLDKIYTYSSFEVSTYEKDGIDYISGISLMDDTVSTKEGISLFQTLEELKSMYGEEYTEENGVYTYTRAQSEISFMVKANKIVQIEYLALHE